MHEKHSNVNQGVDNGWGKAASFLSPGQRCPSLRPAMAEIRTTDLTTLDTEALRKRIAELGRYL